MAIFYLRVRTFGRSRGKSGSSATSAAAYRSGERIRDERTGRVYDHRRRADVVHKQIVLPAQLAAQRDSLAWARNRTTLWNAAEHAESRRNSRVAREFIVALPHELAPEQRAHLAMQFGQAIADRYGSAVDIAIHTPRGDARNHHAHLLATTREITPDGLARKTTLELSGTQRYELGLPRWREEIRSLREHWADLTNTALERAHVPMRVTHLSRAERGLAPSEAPPRVPLAAYHMERRGQRSFLAEKIRERHRAEYERSQSAPASHASGPSASERREGRFAANARTAVASARSMLRNMGTAVRDAWRGLQGTLDAESREMSPAPASSARGSTALANVVSRAGPERLSNVPALRHEMSNRLAQLDQAALKSAQKWLASREMRRVREVSSLGHVQAETRGEELAADRSEEHSRGQRNEYSL